MIQARRLSAAILVAAALLTSSAAAEPARCLDAETLTEYTIENGALTCRLPDDEAPAELVQLRPDETYSDLCISGNGRLYALMVPAEETDKAGIVSFRPGLDTYEAAETLGSGCAKYLTPTSLVMSTESEYGYALACATGTDGSSATLLFLLDASWGAMAGYDTAVFLAPESDAGEAILLDDSMYDPYGNATNKIDELLQKIHTGQFLKISAAAISPDGYYALVTGQSGNDEKACVVDLTDGSVEWLSAVPPVMSWTDTNEIADSDGSILFPAEETEGDVATVPDDSADGELTNDDGADWATGA